MADDKKKVGGWKKLFVTSGDDDKDTITTPSPEEIAQLKSTTPKTSAPKTVKPLPSVNSVKNSPASTSTTTSLSKEFDSYFDEFFKEANFPGPDYYEFMQAIKELESEAMEEKAKFVSVFMGFKVQGVTKQNLIDAGKKYIALVEQQKADFKVDVQSKINGDVAQKQNKADALKAENEKIEQQMQELADRKNQNAEALKALKSEISDDIGSASVTTFKASDKINDVVSHKSVSR